MAKHDLSEKQDENVHPVKDEPKKQGEIPRTRDDSEDDKKSPYREKK
ncbi:hypothetical protein O7047_06785 [Pseudenterobacter timonensis]|uniref:Uncharacterized protein n=1 Tax=Pseudenterobacter timonensis TaxID=1755099 RepID=A0AAE4DLD0_9ENTR|nr:hypothetical protein [Pseudenterobacter timonensis]MDR9889940.1 hypothetical protein [Pseudenterobacter timonensis]